MKKIKFIFFSFLVFFIVVEVFVRITSVDIDYLRYTLYYSPAHSSMHTASDNPELLYELRPGQQETHNHSLHPKEIKNYRIRESTNEYGYRYSPWKIKKPDGVFRIVVFGGSNVYGVSVSDEDTFSFKLFKKLDKIKPKKFEVWNGGLTASVLSQKIVLAQRAVDKLDPDLIIIKHFHNTGRRAFYAQGEKIPEASSIKEKAYFKKNPELYLENIPLLFFDNKEIVQIHYKLLTISAFYRMFQILFNNYFVKLTFPNHDRANCADQTSLCSLIGRKYHEYADYVSEREFDKFIKKNGHLKVIMFDPVGQIFCNQKNPRFRGVPSFSLCTSDKPDEYRHIHPPSYVYDYYADKTYEYLFKNNYLPLN